MKRYREEKGPDGRKRIVLQPENGDFEPIVISRGEADEVRVIGEVVTF